MIIKKSAGVMWPAKDRIARGTMELDDWRNCCQWMAVETLWLETCGSIIWPSGSVLVRVHAKPAVPVPVPVLFKTDFSVPVLVALLKRFIILPHSTSHIFMKKNWKTFLHIWSIWLKYISMAYHFLKIFAHLIYLPKKYAYIFFSWIAKICKDN